MKRSEINSYIDQAVAFFDKHHFKLPSWACYSPVRWSQAGEEYDEIRRNAMGWDITDFAKGNFRDEGLTAFTLRNGNLMAAGAQKTYCEKIMIAYVGQVTPMHFHWKKMEDIINRGGGPLAIELWKANEDETMSPEEFSVKIDGVVHAVKGGDIVRLSPGESITLEPYVYHKFWAENEPCLIGEVSKVNDDDNDNRFYEPLGRYPQIIEDEAPRYLLCNEY